MSMIFLKLNTVSPGPNHCLFQCVTNPLFIVVQPFSRPFLHLQGLEL